jgi:hypothetical protein
MQPSSTTHEINRKSGKWTNGWGTDARPNKRRYVRRDEAGPTGHNFGRIKQESWNLVDKRRNGCPTQEKTDLVDRDKLVPFKRFQFSIESAGIVQIWWIHTETDACLNEHRVGTRKTSLAQKDLFIGSNIKDNIGSDWRSATVTAGPFMTARQSNFTLIWNLNTLGLTLRPYCKFGSLQSADTAKVDAIIVDYWNELFKFIPCKSQDKI